MPASRILVFARTSRCAMVFSVTKKALAISAVVSPQMVRSVKAICASSGKAGWQQVKMSRKTSSCNAPLRRLFFRNPLADAMVGHLLGFDLFALGQKAHMTPQPVDRLVAADIDEPGARIGRDAFARPLHERRGEGILHGVLGELKVAEQADQRGQNAAALVAEQQSDLIRHL